MIAAPGCLPALASYRASCLGWRGLSLTHPGGRSRMKTDKPCAHRRLAWMALAIPVALGSRAASSAVGRTDGRRSGKRGRQAGARGRDVSAAPRRVHSRRPATRPTTRRMAAHTIAASSPTAKPALDLRPCSCRRAASSETDTIVPGCRWSSSSGCVSDGFLARATGTRGRLAARRRCQQCARARTCADKVSRQCVAKGPPSWWAARCARRIRCPCQ